MKQSMQLLFETWPGMDGAKMAASNALSHLEPFDTPKQVKTKVAKSFCEPGNLTDNVALALSRLFVFPYLDGRGLSCEGRTFSLDD